MAAACTAEAIVDGGRPPTDEGRRGKEPAAGPRSTPLLDAYCTHLHECMHALQGPGADDVDGWAGSLDPAAQEAELERRWEDWRERWAALLRQPDPTAARAKAMLEAELSGRSREEQTRLRYLAERVLLSTLAAK